MRRILMLLHEDPSDPTGGMGVHVDAIARRLSSDHDVVILGARQDLAGLDRKSVV